MEFSNTLSLVGVIFALGLLAFMAMKGFNILMNAVVCSIIVAVTSGLNVYNAMLQDYMTGFVGFFKLWFFTFLAGTMFGKFMEESGAARGIAVWIVKKLGTKRALLAVVLATGIIAYGGVSVFVVVFTLFPIALHLFREANLPRRFIGPTIIFGSITFAMTCPGTPQIHNLVPTRTLPTTPMAGTVIGFVIAAGMLVVGQLLLEWMVKKELEKGEGFQPFPSDTFAVNESEPPNGLMSLIPLIASLLLLNAPLLPRLNADKTPMVNAAGKALRGGLPVEVSVLLGIIIGIVVLHKFYDFKKFPKLFTTAAGSATAAIANTCAVVGFGTVVRAAPAFNIILQGVSNIPGPPLVGAAIATTVIAGICGSASGGITLALPILWPVYGPLGVNPNAFHRVLSIACGGLDSLPHNGYVVTALNSVCGTTHKQGYAPVFWLTVILPLVFTIIAIILFGLFPNLP